MELEGDRAIDTRITYVGVFVIINRNHCYYHVVRQSFISRQIVIKVSRQSLTGLEAPLRLVLARRYTSHAPARPTPARTRARPATRSANWPLFSRPRRDASRRRRKLGYFLVSGVCVLVIMLPVTHALGSMSVRQITVDVTQTVSKLHSNCIASFLRVVRRQT